MKVLIDGYNLIWGAHLVGRGAEEGTLRGSRFELLDLLVLTLPRAELPEITVVFDAAEAPPGLPWQVRYQGIRVRFAAEYDDADALLEEYIQEHTAPRRLTVVSSDHRVQRAAKRRRASAVDSEAWIRQLWQEYRRAKQKRAPGKPPSPLPPRERDWWLAQLQQERETEETPPSLASKRADRKLAHLLSSLKRRTQQKQTPAPSAKSQTTAKQQPKRPPKSPGKRSQESSKESLEKLGYNPFPADYADDLLQGEQPTDWFDVDDAQDGK